MADSHTDASEDRQSKRAHIESVQNAEHAATESALSQHLERLLGSNVRRGRGNSTVRAAAIQQAQSLHGNRAIQRFMQSQSSGSPVPVQRNPWSDLPLEPPCPIIPVGPQIGCRPLGDGGGTPVKPSPTPTPGKKKKGEKPVKTKGKGQKGGKPGEKDKDGGFTMTLEDFIKLTGYNPLEGIGGRGGIMGGGKRWPY